MSEATVLFYSGPRGETHPRALVIEAQEIPVTAIIYRDLTEDFTTRRRQRRYLCVVRDELWEVLKFDNGSSSCRRAAPSP